MIVVGIQGGLGNQLFQYGFALYLRKNLPKWEIFLDFTWYIEQQANENENLRLPDIKELGYLQLPEIKTSSIPKSSLSRVIRILRIRVLGSKVQFRFFKNTILTKRYDEEEGFDEVWKAVENNSFISGYFQDQKYILEGRSEILKLFHDYRVNNYWKIEKFLNGNTNYVSLHIRRGDYLIYSTQFPLCTIEYFNKAIDLIDLNVANPHFLIFTDDIDWFRGNLKDLKIEGRFTECSSVLNNACDELMLMSICEHNIISNSSFSWWGAYLNNTIDKIIVAPKIWFGISERQKLNTTIVPDSWIRI